LINRQRPEEAVKLTMQLHVASPNSTPATINHSLALLLSQRTEEARAILQPIIAERLSAEEAASYYTAWFEIYFNQRQFEQAWRVSDRIDPRFLLPVQMEWLERTKQQMPPRVAVQ
jgi:hypothetical protein